MQIHAHIKIAFCISQKIAPSRLHILAPASKPPPSKRSRYFDFPFVVISVVVFANAATVKLPRTT